MLDTSSTKLFANVDSARSKFQKSKLIKFFNKESQPLILIRETQKQGQELKRKAKSPRERQQPSKNTSKGKKGN